MEKIIYSLYSDKSKITVSLWHSYNFLLIFLWPGAFLFEHPFNITQYVLQHMHYCYQKFIVLETFY